MSQVKKKKKKVPQRNLGQWAQVFIKVFISISISISISSALLSPEYHLETQTTRSGLEPTHIDSKLMALQYNPPLYKTVSERCESTKKTFHLPSLALLEMPHKAFFLKIELFAVNKSITLRHASPLTLSRRHHIKKGPLHRAGIGYEAAGKGKISEKSLLGNRIRKTIGVTEL